MGVLEIELSRMCWIRTHYIGDMVLYCLGVLSAAT